MKVAIISEHVLGIEFANYLSSLGADVVLFKSLTTNQTLIAPDIRIITDKLLWVQKKSLSAHDLLGKERMKDLFRLVFEVKPDFVSTDASYSLELQTSLKKELDMFVDVDGVISFEDKFSNTNFSHPSYAPALGEIKSRSLASLMYEPEVGEIHLPDLGAIAVVGHSLYSTSAFTKIFQWLDESKEKDRRVFWITHQSNPWEQISNEALLKFQDKFDQVQEQKIQNFLEKNKSWMELEDYEKVKIAKPQEPIPQLVIFAGHHLAVIDSLLNSKKLYLTFENSPFQIASIQKDNALKELKTISVDQLLIFNGYKFERSWESYLTDSEPGFLTYYTQQLSLGDVIKDFQKNFLVFFKKESEGHHANG